MTDISFETIIANVIREQLLKILPSLAETVTDSVSNRLSANFQKEEKPLSTEEVCILFDIHPQTANRWRRNGRLPYHTSPGGRKVFYFKSEVMAAIKDNPSKRKSKAKIEGRS